MRIYGSEEQRNKMNVRVEGERNKWFSDKTFCERWVIEFSSILNTVRNSFRASVVSSYAFFLSISVTDNIYGTRHKLKSSFRCWKLKPVRSVDGRRNGSADIWIASYIKIVIVIIAIVTSSLSTYHHRRVSQHAASYSVWLSIINYSFAVSVIYCFRHISSQIFISFLCYFYDSDLFSLFWWCFVISKSSFHQWHLPWPFCIALFIHSEIIDLLCSPSIGQRCKCIVDIEFEFPPNIILNSSFREVRKSVLSPLIPPKPPDANSTQEFRSFAFGAWIHLWSAVLLRGEEG